MIESEQVPSAIREVLPEFAGIVDTYLADLAHVPGAQLLAGSIFLAFDDLPESPQRAQLAQRIGAFVDHMLRDGSNEVRDGFIAEFIDPLINTRTDKNHQIEAYLGPLARQTLESKREWWRRYIAVAVVVRKSSKRNANVFGSVGLGNDATRIRVVADRALWEDMRIETREKIFRELQREWQKIAGPSGAVEITGSKAEGFPILR